MIPTILLIPRAHDKTETTAIIVYKIFPAANVEFSIFFAKKPPISTVNAERGKEKKRKGKLVYKYNKQLELSHNL